jgi:nitrogen fixation protein NifU and related proteins
MGNDSRPATPLGSGGAVGYDRGVAAYSDLVMEHFENPRNAGEMESPDGEATVSNPVCGDRMRVMVRVDDGRVAEVRWLTRGCPPAIATSSFASEMVRGWTLEQIDGLTRETIADGIGGLPKDKVHCSVLAADALKAAVSNYRAKS